MKHPVNSSFDETGNNNNDNKDNTIFIKCYALISNAPDTVVNVLCMLIHLLLTTTI